MSKLKIETPAKFAYIICDPGNDDNPLLTSINIQSELQSSRIQNLTLEKVDAKNNISSLPIKYIKYLKDNYYYLSSSTNIYDSNKFKNDHYLFLYAFSDDATYPNLKDFKSHILKKYGNIEFLPFHLNQEKVSRLILLSRLQEFLMDLYSAREVNAKNLEKAESYFSLLSKDMHEKFTKALDFKTRSSTDLEFLTSFSKKEINTLLTSGWN